MKKIKVSDHLSRKLGANKPSIKLAKAQKRG